MSYSQSDKDSINPLWHLVDPLTVEQAAVLIAGFDPNLLHFDHDKKHAWFESDGYTDTSSSSGTHWVQTALIALTNAINAKSLKAKLRYGTEPRYVAEIDNFSQLDFRGCEDVQEIKDASGECYVISPNPDWSISMISRSDLISWLESKNFRTGFFFTAKTDDPDYLNPKHPRYAPKLAAAVQAWKTVTDAAGKHPKQALAKWLREHAAEFDMTDDEGKPNETGIEEVAKVANWQPKGGTPKTQEK